MQQSRVLLRTDFEMPGIFLIMTTRVLYTSVKHETQTAPTLNLSVNRTPTQTPQKRRKLKPSSSLEIIAIGSKEEQSLENNCNWLKRAVHLK